MYRFAICDDDSQFASLLKEALITNLNRRNILIKFYPLTLLPV